jgi:hypothetical protein
MTMTERSEKSANAIDDPLAASDLHALPRQRVPPPVQMDLDEVAPDDPTGHEELEDAPEDAWLDVADAIEAPGVWLPPSDPGVLAESSPWRWAIAFAVIAMLLALVCLIVFWGLTHSSWWY